MAGEGYDDKQLARALRKTGYKADETKVFPDGTANIFDPNYNPGYPKPWTRETAYSYYFHKISEQHCGNVGRGITYRNPR